MSYYKSYLSLAGAMVANLVFGNSLSWINFSGYFFEYINDSSINKYDRTWIFTFFSIIIIVSNSANMLSSYFTPKMNIRTILLISFFCLISSHFIFYYTSSSSTIILGSVLYGVGIGFAYRSVIRNIWEYFPSYKPLISFLCVLSFTLSAPIFNFLLIILLHDPSWNFFDESAETGERVRKYIWGCIIIYTVCGLISTGLSFDFYYENEELGGEMGKKLLNQNEKEYSISSLRNTKNNMISRSESSDFLKSQSGRESLVSETSLNTVNTNIHNLISGDHDTAEKEIERKIVKKFKKVMSSFNFYLVVLYNGFGLIFSFCIMMHLIDGRYMENEAEYDSYFNATTIYIISISVSRILVPMIVPNSKYVVIFFLVLQSLLSFALFYYIEQYPEYFPAVIALAGVCFAELSTSLSSMISNIYGIDLAMMLSSIVLGLSILIIIIPTIEVLYFSKEIIFKLFTLTGCACSLFAIAIFLCINHGTFDYSNQKGEIELNDENPSGERVDTNFDSVSINDVKSEREI